MVTQFQGAFSDNALKNMVILLMIVGVQRSQTDRYLIGEMVAAIFSLPFIIFSMTGGFLADRISKRTVTMGVKVFEVLVMTVALTGLMLNSLPIQLTAVFLMGTHSAIFGPSKYGLLPELLPEKRLSWGNGVLELGTFLAIILGTVAGAAMASQLRGSLGWAGVILIALALVGLLTSMGITRVPAANPAKRFRINFAGELWSQIRLIRQDRVLFLAVIGNTYFWFLGALLQRNLFFQAEDGIRDKGM